MILPIPPREFEDDSDDDSPEGCAGSPVAGKAAAVPLPAVSAADHGQRLDKWLATAAPDYSRSRLKALVGQGCLSCAGQTIKDASARVKSGQHYQLTPPAPVDALPQPQNIPLAIVYEDSDLVVIDKPAGMVVHPAAGNADGTLVNALLWHCGDSLSGIGGVIRPGIVHRIDKDTSGLLVIAKNDRAHHGLAEQFAAHSLERAYQAIVWGCPAQRHGEISGNIGRSPQNRQKMAVVKSGGKTALTRYRVLSSLAGGQLSHIECRLATGRTHQIRVHMTSLGHALVGDPLYGSPRSGKQLPAEAREACAGFSRQALHAWLLGFRHPCRDEVLRFESPLPEDMSRLLEALKEGEQGKGE